MGIPGLINAIGPGDRIALSRLAITHLERTSRPIRIAVDISIWLFQVQAGRGGTNPELRTLLYRLLKFLALPVHPLFVYDGRQKPPFKRGKAVSGRSYGSAPIIRLSKTLIDVFKFPWHEAPGEAEAECARLQRAGVVDAVMSNDVDALMFGSTLTVMNFSKEKSSGTGAATHITCYRTQEEEGLSANVSLDSDGMVLFALLSGGDYLPSGVPKCGSKLAAEIAKAGFGSDLLEILRSNDADADADAKLDEWRTRLQYELDENESGYFQTKHKAVRIPETFPDRAVLSYYANPVVSTSEEVEALRNKLTNAWDHEVDALELRMFASDFLDWKYRSGAKKIVKLLAEPLVSYRLRLQKPASVLQGYGSFVPNRDVPTMQRVHRSRTHWSTDGLSQLQLEIIPINIVGLDLDDEEPNPPRPQQEVLGSEDVIDEEDRDSEAEPQAQDPANSQQPAKFYDPYERTKVWVLETLAKMGVPDVVESWKQEQNKKTPAPKNTAPKKTTTRKKKPIDPGMKPGSLFKYYGASKSRSEMSPAKQALLLDAARSRTPPKSSPSSTQDQDEALSTPPARLGSTMKTYGWQRPNFEKASSTDLDELVSQFSLACTVSEARAAKRRPTANIPYSGVRGRALCSNNVGIELDGNLSDDEVSSTWSPPPLPRQITVSYSNVDFQESIPAESTKHMPCILISSSPPVKEQKRVRRKSHQTEATGKDTREIEDLESALVSLTVSEPSNYKPRRTFTPSRQRDPSVETDSPRVISQAAEVVTLSSSPPIASTIPSPETSLPSPESLLELGSESGSPAHEQRIVQSAPEVASEDLRGPHQTSITLQPENSPSKPERPSRKPRERATHIHSVRTHDGRWTADDTLGEEPPSPDSQHPEHSSTNSTSTSPQKRHRKRIPRVSILDLS